MSRNLEEYPITAKEIEAYLNTALERAIDSDEIGSTDIPCLHQIIEIVKKYLQEQRPAFQKPKAGMKEHVKHVSESMFAGGYSNEEVLRHFVDLGYAPVFGQWTLGLIIWLRREWESHLPASCSRGAT